MPVDHRLAKDGLMYQREVYSKSMLTRILRDFLDNLALKAIKDSKTVLDIGCGEGLLLEKIIAAKKEASVYGIDLNPENVEICLAHSLPAILADAKKLPFADRTFDTCIMTEVIEHLEQGQPQDVIREIARVLKEGGQLFLMFPNDRNYKISRLLTFKFKKAFYDAGHTRQWEPEDAADLLQQMSFFIHRSLSVPINVWQFSLNHIIIGIKNASRRRRND